MLRPNATTALVQFLSILLASLVDRNLLIIDTVPGCIRCGRVTGIYVEYMACKNARRRIAHRNHLYLELHTTSCWNLYGSGLRLGGGPVAYSIATKGRKRGDRIEIAELDSARLDLIVAGNAIAFRPQESAVVAEDSCLCIGWKIQGLH